MAAEASIVAWVNAFELKSSVKSVEELRDGIALFQILSTVQEQHFPPNAVEECGNDTKKQEENLERLSACLELFFEDVTGNAQNVDVDLEKVIKSDKKEICKLAEYVILASIQSEKKEEVVNKIMSLEEDNQQKMMHIVEDMLQRMQDGPKPPSTPTKSKSESMDDQLQTPATHDRHRSISDVLLSTAKSIASRDDTRLIEENERLQSQVRTLESKNKILLENVGEYKETIQSLEERLARKIEKGGSTGESTRLNEMKKEISKLRAIKKDLTSQLSQHKEQLMDYKEKYEKLESTAKPQILTMRKRITKLQDELDLANSKAEEHAMVSNQLSRYKARLGQMAEIKQQLKDAEDAHEKSLQKIWDLEDENKQIPTLKEKLGKLKKDMDVKDLELKRLQKKEAAHSQSMQSLFEEKERDSEFKDQQSRKIAFLEEQLRMSKAEAENPGMPVESLADIAPRVDLKTKEKLMRLERDKSRLEKKVEELPQLKDNLQQLTAKHEQTIQEISAAKKEVSKLRTELDAARIEAKMAKEAAKAESLREPDATEIENGAQLRSRNNKLKKHLREAVNDLKKQALELTATKTELKSAKAALKAIEQLEAHSPRPQSLAVTELKLQLKEKTAYERQLKERMERMRENYKKEQLLISNAFHSLGVEAHIQLQNLAFQRDPSSRSWLAKQRAKNTI
mmetsp:Transcript_18158/g.27251  ORF Transcript_18158/g.27251 Transcript_18158/m.27251 type:complete len:683 (+) Transcript_18158:74-2122(+)